MPKAPTPPHILKQTGRDRPRDVRGKADISVAALKALPPPPYWLSEGVATQEYERLGELLIPRKMLTSTNIMSFCVYCSLHAAIVVNLTVNQLPPASVIAQYRGLLQDFGLTPLAMMKFPQMMVNPPENEDGTEASAPKNVFSINGTSKKKS